MIPFVRTVEELTEVKKIVSAAGLVGEVISIYG